MDLPDRNLFDMAHLSMFGLALGNGQTVLAVVRQASVQMTQKDSGATKGTAIYATISLFMGFFLIEIIFLFQAYAVLELRCRQYVYYKTIQNGVIIDFKVCLQ